MAIKGISYLHVKTTLLYSAFQLIMIQSRAHLFTNTLHKCLPYTDAMQDKLKNKNHIP